MTRAMDRDAEASGRLLFSEHHILATLNEGPPEGLRPMELAEQAGLTKSGLTRAIDRLWVHTRTFDHPRALGYYQQAGFEVYARRPLRFEDPRIRGFLPRSLRHSRLPPLD